MPTTVLRLRVLLAGAGLAALPLLALATPVRAVTPAVVVHAPAGTPTPCETFPLNTCPRATPTPDPTQEPTESPSAEPTRTTSPEATRSKDPTRSPHPRSTFTDGAGSTASPVTATIGVGAVAPGTTDTTPSTEPAASTSPHTGVKITRLLELVLGGAVLLGLVGALGLYLTRHRHDH